MRRQLRIVAFLQAVLLSTTLLGCAPGGVPWGLDRGLFRPVVSEADWSLGNERLARALSAYQRADYEQARTLFLRVVLETDTEAILDRAMLGAALSGLLSAENADDVARHLHDFDSLASALVTTNDALVPDLLRPVFRFALAFHEEQRSKRMLHAEFEVKSRQVAALQSEVALLRSQVEELEALFQFLEQQKRQLTIPGSIR